MLIVNSLVCGFTLLVVLMLAVYVRRSKIFLLKKIDRNFGEMKSYIWALQSLANSMNKAHWPAYPGEWAAHPDFIAFTLQIIEQRKPKLVVELGSGFSTVCIAQKLKELGNGKLITIEHDETFAAKTGFALAQQGLVDFVELRVAPLTSFNYEVSGAPWYQEDGVWDLREIDFLIIDGPPAPFGERIRSRAVEAIGNRLAKSSVVIWDDTNRPGERSAMNLWASSFPDDEIRQVPLERGAFLILRNH